ncbi:hypothetical protein [Limosilactobacillus coleohominis]|uniref:hypothetical protein n=1 Tax=Limosilactobacillus coleohominis TaxID=181675 RepID=UPI001959FFD1|nr:hypothetical protein [Limosilactobacillus coleohominis]MBM6954651.1 hypothetical protein [Limosilactobacillus coleohominis]
MAIQVILKDQTAVNLPTVDYTWILPRLLGNQQFVQLGDHIFRTDNIRYIRNLEDNNE